ncbi:MAG: pyrimidine-specific ribonucleoside hydrolase RihA [Erysipelotrichaceae bacterium]|nr:pyrimidine-specific ribonucleoside hydrolase RihA [Erysipelotrichaceae bacterium]
MYKVIIDCDPGHDDIMAIFCALANKEKIDILGYTTVCGNNLLDKVTDNLCNVLSFLNIEAMVAKGAHKPLFYDSEPQPIAHGESGLDGPVFTYSNLKPINLNANDFLYNTISKEEKVILFGLGPLTNIASFIQKHPDIISKIDKLIIMGGSIYKGNILEESEFNIYCDPHSAKIVFDSSLDIILAPLEVCDFCTLHHNIIEDFKDKSKLFQLTYEILEFYFRYSKRKGDIKSPVFDLAVPMYLLHPEIFEGKNAFVDIILDQDKRGKTIINYNEKGNTLVLDKCDNHLFEQYFLNDLNTLEKLL